MNVLLERVNNVQAEVLVILATYNESQNLRLLLARVLEAAPVDVLVIDDNSPDGTGDMADDIARNEPRVTVVHRKAKLGLASARLLGVRHAESCGYKFVIEMDADFSHPPKDLPRLIEACQNADVVIG